MVSRIPSGVPGVDDLIDGGIPKSSVVLVSGTTGAGKTTFSSQFLWEGFQDGESTLFISLEELPEAIRGDAAEFGWDFDEDADGSFQIFYIDPATKTSQTTASIADVIDDTEPDRVVIDSISVLEAYWGDKKQVRGNVHNLVKEFRERDMTTLITAEMPDPERGALTRYGMVEYVVDGVFALGGLSFGTSTFRSFQVIKMRKTAIDGNVYALEMTGDGLTVEEEERF